jgi:AcrR family transcriptional regulator
MLTSKYVSSAAMTTSTQSKRSPRRRRTQAQRRELSDQRMLDAAFKLIERQGGSRTTLVEIGELSGYSHGLVSYRFGSKGELVRAATRRLQHEFARMLEPALAGLHGLHALVVTAETYLRTAAASGRNAMYVLIGEALGPLQEIRGEIAAADDNFRLSVQKLVEEGMRTGEIRSDVDPPAYAALFVGSLRGLVVQHLMKPRAFDLDQVCRELSLSIERSLSPAPRTTAVSGRRVHAR